MPDGGSSGGSRGARGAWHRRRWLLIALGVCLAALAASLVIPGKLAGWPAAPYYAVGYLPDEYAYLQRLDAPPSGASATNPYNHCGDPSVISPFFLDTCCRAFMRLTSVDVVAFFWLWRAAFPAVLLLTLFWLARAAIPRQRRIWAGSLHWAAAGAGLALLYALFHLLVDDFTLYHYDGYVPIFFFLNRIPTNVEFVLALALLALYLQFLNSPALRRGILLVLVGAATVYLRPYAALPWGLAMALGLGYVIYQRALPRRIWLWMVAAFVLALLPWGVITAWNGQSQTYREQMQHLFQWPFPYRVHDRWLFFLIAAAVLLAVSWWLEARRRVAIVSGALVLAALPFFCGAVPPVARELLSNDRFGCFHLVLLIGAGLALVGSRAERWRGRVGLRTARRWTAIVAGLGLGLAGLVAAVSLRFEFAPNYNPAFLTRDVNYFEGYEWVKQHTPADALFLVDDGYDWSIAQPDAQERFKTWTAFMCFHNDLFHTLAHRQRVFCFSIFVQTISNEDLQGLSRLHAATLGQPMEGGAGAYLALLKKYRPGYVFWRKTPPIFLPMKAVEIPRGQNSRLLQLCRTVVHEDDFCQIWQLDYGAIERLTAVPLPARNP